MFNPDERSPFVEDTYHGSVDRTFDLLHMTLRVSFDWPKAHMKGQAQLTMTPYFYPRESVTLDARGFDLHQVGMLNEAGVFSELPYLYESDELTISLPKTYNKGEQFILQIDYTAKPNELQSGGSEAITDDKGLYFINPDGSEKDKPTQLWTQGETESNSAWFPTFEQTNERMTQEIYMTVDARYVTLSNGSLISQTTNADGTRTDLWRMDKPHAPYLVMMAVGEFAVVKDQWEGLEVNYYVQPEYAPYAKAIFGNTPEMLTFYSNLFGVRYPWSKYSQIVVEDFVSGAMENTTATVHYGGLHRDSRELLDETDEDIVAHEVMHQWFGDLVTCESWANIPLNEAFATYGEYLWMEYKYGREEADLHLDADLDVYLDESAGKQEPLIRFGYSDREDMFDAHSYQKGGRVLHMLRKILGDEAFFAGLNKYLTDHAFTDVEIDELRMAFEDVSGKDLRWFFTEWFMNPGHPILSVDYFQNEEGGAWTLRVRQLHSNPNTPVYRLPVDVDVYRNGKAVRQRIEIDQREQEFALGSPDADWINFDAEKMILGMVEESKPEAWYARQLSEGPLYKDRADALAYYEGLAEESPEANAMLAKAFDDKFWGIQEWALDSYVLGAGLDPNTLEKIKTLASTHPKSDVRVAALRNIGGLEDPGYAAMFRKAINDSSYRVVSVAMRELARIEPQEAMTLAGQYEDNKNISLAVGVLRIYAQNAGPEKNDFFVRKMEEFDGYERYIVIQAYGSYLARQDNFPAVLEGCQLIMDAAEESPVWWMTQVAQSSIQGVMARYESDKEALGKSDPSYKEQIAALDAQIASLEAILSPEDN